MGESQGMKSTLRGDPGREGTIVLARARDEKALGASEDHEDFLLGLSPGVAGKGSRREKVR